jgi:hypothetical protein
MNDVQLEAWLDQEDKRTAATIRKYGWHLSTSAVAAATCRVAMGAIRPDHHSVTPLASLASVIRSC